MLTSDDRGMVFDGKGKCIDTFLTAGRARAYVKGKRRFEDPVTKQPVPEHWVTPEIRAALLKSRVPAKCFI